MSVVIGVDVATASVRAVAADLDGVVLTTESAALPPVRRSGARSEQDASSYAAAARSVIGRAAQTMGARARDVVALSITGTSGTVVPCDGGGTPAGPALMYDDRRAADLVERVAGVTDGLPQQALLATPTSALARIAWLQRHTPALTCLSTPDVVLAHLAGHLLAADTSHALKSGADPERVAWPTGVLAGLGIPDRALPALVTPGTQVGVVTDAVAADLGLPSGVALVAGMTDGCTAQIAAGAVASGATVGVLGTTLVLKGVAPTSVSGFEGAVYSHRSPTGEFWPGGASNVGAAALRDHGEQQDLASADVAALARGPSSTLRYPLVGEGERFPFVAPAARGFTVGRSVDRTDSYRAVLEGVAFVERLGLERLRARGVVSARHHAVGGGSRSTAWLRIRATVLGRPLHRAAEADSGFGAAVLAASLVHGGLAEATRAMVRTDLTVDPDESERSALDERYHELLEELAVRGWLVAETTHR
jgi:D-ribulokinase